MHEEFDRTYRQRPYFRNLAIGCTLFFAFAWVGFALAAYFNVDGSFARPGLAIIFCSIVFGSFSLLGVWLILTYFKYQLLFSCGNIRQIGVVQFKEIHLDEIRELKWNLRPVGGSCVMTSIDSKITVEFNHFEELERQEIIDYLHGNVSNHCQTNWESFYNCFIEPAPEKIREQKFLKYGLILAIFAFAAVFFSAWLSGRGLHYLLIAIVNILIGTWALVKDYRSQIAS